MSGKDVFRKALLFAVDHAQPIASALILAGYIGALVLPFLNKGTFFDENALMVHNSIPGIGYARDQFGTTAQARFHHQGRSNQSRPRTLTS